MSARTDTHGADAPGTDTPAVRISGLTHRYGDTPVVDGLDLTVEPGSATALLGPNGAGKSTTLRVLTTLLPAKEGTVEVFGRSVRTERMAVRRLIGYVPQQISVERGLTGRENVAWFARLLDVPRRQVARRTAELLEAMDLTDAADSLAATYSGGMVRRLELAQALVGDPALLVLDEPTVGLDPVVRDDVWHHIRRVQAELGMTVLLTTHYMEEVEAMCDTVALMHHGRLQAAGTPAELKAQVGPGASLDDVFRHHSGNALVGTEPTSVEPAPLEEATR